MLNSVDEISTVVLSQYGSECCHVRCGTVTVIVTVMVTVMVTMIVMVTVIVTVTGIGTWDLFGMMLSISSGTMFLSKGERSIKK